MFTMGLNISLISFFRKIDNTRIKGQLPKELSQLTKLEYMYVNKSVLLCKTITSSLLDYAMAMF